MLPVSGGTAGRRPEPANGTIAPSASRRRPILLLHFDYFEALSYQGVVDWVREHRWTLDASWVRSLELPRMTRVDGILTIAKRSKTLEWLKQFGVPMVMLHSPSLRLLSGELCHNIPAVECDFESIGHLGAQHLLTLGNPHFVFYQRSQGTDVERLKESFVATMRAAGHEPTVLSFDREHPLRNKTKPTTFEERFQWLAQHLERLPKPMAVMAEDDRFAPDVVEVAEQLNLRVPTEVAVLGCDNNPLALGVSPIPISSVESNCRGVGYAGAALLARLVAGEPPPAETLRLAARGVIGRLSTATYSGRNPAVNLALQHLRQNYRESLTMESVARVARVSVRTLQAAYRQEIGGTMQEELTHLRVTAAERLLEETDLKVFAVAAETGFGNVKNLCRVFAKVHGVSPGAWRRRDRAPA